MTTPENMSRRDELEALLPFYLNGTLDGPDLEAVEQWLATDPEAAAALDEAEAEFSNTAAANEAILPSLHALSRFSKSLDAEAGPARMVASPSALAQLWNRFKEIPVGVAWAAAAAAIALVLVQAVLEPTSQRDDFEIAGTDELAKMPFAFVSFKPDARIADITAFLTANGATLLAGPAAGGVFKIGISATTAADYDRLVGLIAAQPFAETVAPGRKPDNGS